ncbi:FHA domain-containing protein [Streptomyces tsukubensis]|uniref:FHA domain-containing protein n=1 Tax=Streptomyces tsukubensis TaxID=83656 RepID=UPI001D03C4D4|nr:FHA domain-containing protein [Streptomyces tsukubensis]
MQIRLTVLGPRSGPTVRACDVLVTAPAGTALASVASGLAAAAQGGEGSVALYAGADRLDPHRTLLGEPPLVDGAVLTLQLPGGPGPTLDGSAAQLHVVAGPDAGGVHLLHGGEIRIGRSAEADVTLDDPDVSRAHCAVTLDDDGLITVADLGSTNGTAVDGEEIGTHPVRLAQGTLLRIGESALRLASGRIASDPASTVPDGEGHLRVRLPSVSGAAGTTAGTTAAPGGVTESGVGDFAGAGPGTAGGPGTGYAPVGQGGPGGRSGQTYPGDRLAPGAAGSQDVSGRPGPVDGGPAGRGDDRLPEGPHAYGAAAWGAGGEDGARSSAGMPYDEDGGGRGDRKGPRKRGLSAWARRLAGGRGEEQDFPPQGPGAHAGGPGTHVAGSPGAYAGPHSGPYTDPYTGEIMAPDDDTYAQDVAYDGGDPGAFGAHRIAVAGAPEAWPDLASLLLTALGPGPRLWERGHGHPESFVVRLGSADRTAPDGSGLLPSVPVTVGLREAGALGLAGPRVRLAGLARSVLAQLAALHSPDLLEIVLISSDRARPLPERTAEWAWLGWLPHLRPTHGQDCRLLLAYDREQATARTEELTRRLRSGEAGPRTVLVVDGDPGSASLRESTVHLATEGPSAGIHVVALAETPSASPSSPVAEVYETACAQTPVFRACGAVALLSGDVATALRLMRTVEGRPAGHGTVATADGVSAAWAERFARSLAPLRTDSAPGAPRGRIAAPLPQAARLLDELGLARATPASLMARWAAGSDDPDSPGGRVQAVLGAGPHGPASVDLAGHSGPHLLIDGPPGSGRTELLRSIAASLAAAERPDRLAMVLIDGRDDMGAERGEGLRVCTDLPQVTTHLGANDPVRMREFAQSLAAEVKRRSELLGRLGFAEWHLAQPVKERQTAQRSTRAARAQDAAAAAQEGERASTRGAQAAVHPQTGRVSGRLSGQSGEAATHGRGGQLPARGAEQSQGTEQERGGGAGRAGPEQRLSSTTPATPIRVSPTRVSPNPVSPNPVSPTRVSQIRVSQTASGTTSARRARDPTGTFPHRGGLRGPRPRRGRSRPRAGQGRRISRAARRGTAARPHGRANRGRAAGATATRSPAPMSPHRRARTAATWTHRPAVRCGCARRPRPAPTRAPPFPVWSSWWTTSTRCSRPRWGRRAGRPRVPSYAPWRRWPGRAAGWACI